MERDNIYTDVDDLLDIFALGGEDLIDVALDVGIGGSVTGGEGIDTCIAPADWTDDCEG